jgi:DNA replication protein DnaC
MTAQQYAAEPRDWLVFTGTFGCGKTHLAASIANSRNDEGHPVLFVVVPDLLDHLRAAFNPQSPVSYDKRFDEVRTAPLLVLDDLGTESATAWAREQLYQIINHRYAARLPTVITTAWAIEELDPKVATRIDDATRCKVFAILAPSYRGGKRRDAASKRKSPTPRRGR